MLADDRLEVVYNLIVQVAHTEEEHQVHLDFEIQHLEEIHQEQTWVDFQVDHNQDCC